jgi:histidyl-tRNA synthetase
MGGLLVDYDFLNRSLKAQFKQADRLNSKFYLIYGDQEAKNGLVNVKNSTTGEQVAVPIKELYQYLISKIYSKDCQDGCESCSGCQS